MFMSCPSDCCLHPVICSTGCFCMPLSLSAGIRGASVPFKLKLRTETAGMHSTRSVRRVPLSRCCASLCSYFWMICCWSQLLSSLSFFFFFFAFFFFRLFCVFVLHACEVKMCVDASFSKLTSWVGREGVWVGAELECAFISDTKDDVQAWPHITVLALDSVGFGDVLKQVHL